MLSIKNTRDQIKKLSQSDCSIKLISAGFQRVSIDNPSFIYWMNSFHFIHGKLDSQKKIDLEILSKRYHVSLILDNDIFKLIYVLESFYRTALSLFLHKIASGSIEEFKLLEKLGRNFPVQIDKKKLEPCRLFKDDSVLIDGLYNDIVSEIEFDGEIDLVRELFEDLFDKRIRHSLGEYFTPDWLSQIVIKGTVNGQSIEKKKFLDPTCGSGTFIRNILRLYGTETNGQIFQNVFGIDINPASVYAAQINYLIEYFSFFGNFDGLPDKLPFYETDVIQELGYSSDLFDMTNDFVTDKIGKVDFIVGNPPWVNWEYLPNEYRDRTHQAWKYFALYDGKGLNSNFLKEDISCLITYVVAYKYLCEKGRLGFLLKESLLKSVKQAKQFRKFYLKPENSFLGINEIIDLTNLSPFAGINPRTIALFFTKGIKTNYPLDYIILKSKDGKKRFADNLTLEQIDSNLEKSVIQAMPSNPNDITSSFMTLEEKLMRLANKITGKSEYKARTGVFTGGGNAMFWLNITGRDKDFLNVENLTERAKNKVPKVQTKMEEEYIYPFISGSDIRFWSYKYEKYIVCPHTVESKMMPIGFEELDKFTYMKEYFSNFRDDLQKRKGFTSMDKNIHEKYYYTLL